MRTAVGAIAIVAVLSLSCVSSAQADLTGTYTGKFKCKWTNNDGSKDRESTKNSVFKVIHTPGGAIDVDIDGTRYCGRVIETKTGTKGVGAILVVGTDGNPFDYNEIEYLSWKTSGRARIKKKGFWIDGATIGECKGGWSRQSEEVPVGNFGFCFFGPF